MDQAIVDSSFRDTLNYSKSIETERKVMPIFETLGIDYSPDNKYLKRERNKILKEFYPYGDSMYDTLVDLNYDGCRDYIIGYYGKSGTGYKNGVDVHLYSKRDNKYHLNKILSDLINPSFFIPEHKITGFYIGAGGGGGKKLEWMNNKWVVTKAFNVDRNGDSTIWEIKYPLTGKEQKILRHFQMVPPEEILETNWDF